MNETTIISSDIKEFQNVYSPSTLLGVYANALHTSADGRIILARGIYQVEKTPKEYGGYYYDSIKSPNEAKSIKAKINGQLRSKLENNLIYIFKGYIEKRITFSSIELVFVVDDILQKEESRFSEEDIKRFELLQNKISKGFRDFEAVVKEHVYNNIVLKIANLYGTTAIVNKDFDLGLGEAVVRFKISEHRCNFASKKEIIDTIKKLNLLDYDVIALVRGGGDKLGLEVFNDPELGAEAISVKQLLVTALGHKVDETLLDKIADKKFALPHDYGNSLKVWVDEAIEEQTKSKSIFIEQVKKDLTKTFQEQITTLQSQLGIKNKEFETAQVKFKEMIEQFQKDKAETIKSKEKSIEEIVKASTEQVNTLQNQLGVKNKEFETAQTKFKEMIEQFQKDKAETISSKEKTIEEISKSLTEQIATVQKQLEIKNKEFETSQAKFKEMIEQFQKDKAETIKSKEKSIEEISKALTEQIATVQKQLEIKNKEFETAQVKFKEMIEQYQKEKTETIQQKEKSFEEISKSLTEQIKSKEENLKLIQTINEATLGQQILFATSDLKTKYELLETERERLLGQLVHSSKSRRRLIIYILVAIIVGLTIGLLIKI